MEHLKSNKILWITASLFYSAQLILRVFPNIVINQLSADFGLTSCELGLLASAYYNSYSLIQIPGGILLDRFSVRSLLLFSLTCCIAGSTIFAMSTNIYIAYASRFLAGFGAGFALLSSVKSANLSSKSPKSLSVMIAANFTLAMSCVGINATLINKIVDIFGWRVANFLFTGVIGIILFIAFLAKNPEKNKINKRKQNFAEIFSEIRENCIKVLQNKQLYFMSAYSFCTYVAISSFCDLWGSKFLSVVYNLDYGVAISVCMTMYIGIAIGSIILPYLSHLLNSYKKVLILAELCSFLCFLDLIFIRHSNSLIYLYGIMLILGISTSSMFIGFDILSKIYGQKLAGTANGIYNFASMLSGVIFQPLIGKIIDYSKETLSNNAISNQILLTQNEIISSSFIKSFAVFCILPVLALISAMFIKIPYMKN